MTKTGSETIYFYHFSLLKTCSFVFDKKVGEKCEIRAN